MSAVLPINTSDRYAISTATLAQTDFAIPFPFQAAADLEVVRKVSGVSTPLTLGEDWTAVGENDPGGGTLTLVEPCEGGEQIIIIGDAVLARLASVTLSGKFSSAQIDRDFDRLTLVSQELRRDLGRAWKVPLGEMAGEFIPGANGTTAKWLDGNLVEGPDAGDIEDAQASATAAAASATAAAAAAEIAALAAVSTRLPLAGGTMTGPIGFTHQASPANPTSGVLAVFAKSDEKLYTRTSAGVETEIGAGSGGAAPVTSRTALKALDTTTHPGLVYLSEAGREGWFIWRTGDYSAQVTADTQEGVYVNADAVASSSGAWVRQGHWFFSGILPDWCGAARDNSTDDTTAFNAAINLALYLSCPLALGAGYYKLTSKIQVTLATNKMLRINGAGEDVSLLTWDCEDGGLEITFQADSWWHRTPSLAGNGAVLSGFSLLTNRLYGVSGDALEIIGLVQEGRPMPPVTTSHVRCRGGTGSVAAEWGRGLVLDRVSGTTHEAFSFVGANSQRNAIAIDITASSDSSGDPVEHKFSDPTVLFADVALRAGAEVEGIHLVNHNFVAVSKGVEWAASAESQIAASNGHINCDDYGFDLDGVFDSQIVGNLIFTTGVGVSINDGGYNTIVGNIIRGSGTDGVVLSTAGSWNANWKNVVSDNYFGGLTNAINLGSGTSGTQIGPNAYANVTNKVIGSGTRDAVEFGAVVASADSTFESSSVPITHSTVTSSAATAGAMVMRRARGSVGSESAVQSGDTLAGLNVRGYGATGYSSTGRATLSFRAAEAWTDTAQGTDFILETTPTGSTTRSERLRVSSAGDLQMGGANTVITASRHQQLRSYTVAGLPSATTAGQTIYVSNESGGAVVAFSDGANWRRVTDRAIVS